MAKKAIRPKSETVVLSDGALDTVFGGAGPGENCTYLNRALIIDENRPDVPPDERQQTPSETR